MLGKENIPGPRTTGERPQAKQTQTNNWNERTAHPLKRKSEEVLPVSRWKIVPLIPSSHKGATSDMQGGRAGGNHLHLKDDL